MGNVKDITGRTFGEWEVLSEYGRNKSGGAVFLCRCSCGNERVVDGRSIRCGASTNCGCKRRIHAIEAARKAVKTHGGRFERLYCVWRGMLDRCNNKNSKFYHRYGGRGITVCDEWMDYANFREWAMSHGYDPFVRKGVCTLERMNNDLGYNPANCVWATSMVQCNNRSSNHIINAFGESHTIAEWARRTGIRKDTLRRRICIYGWSPERALKTPVRKHVRKTA